MQISLATLWFYVSPFSLPELVRMEIFYSTDSKVPEAEEGSPFLMTKPTKNSFCCWKKPQGVV